MVHSEGAKEPRGQGPMWESHQSSAPSVVMSPSLQLSQIDIGSRIMQLSSSHMEKFPVLTRDP